MTRELTRERLQNLGADYATELGRTDADVVAAVDMALALLDEREKTSIGLTVGGGLIVYGSSEAISRCQQFILLDSSHPQEREDVRRMLMRDLQKAEKALLDLREGIETLAAKCERKATSTKTVGGNFLYTAAARATASMIGQELRALLTPKSERSAKEQMDAEMKRLVKQGMPSR